MARILAIDYGTKRTGIAVTDPLQIAANPCDTLETKDLKEFLLDYLVNEETETIVIGQSLHRDGSEMYFKKDIEKLIQFLNKEFPKIKIERQDESFTSVEAKELLLKSGVSKKKRRQKGNIDKISAVLILQRYLGHV